MFWRRRKRPDDEEFSVSVDLHSLVGLPGHLTFTHGLIGSHLVTVPCQVKRINRSDIVLQCATQGALPQPESAVILEVANQTALIQCFTTVRAQTNETQVILRRPARPHIVQRRRYPRVDLFLSIAINTPELPLDTLPAQMINLSIDGTACVLVEPLPLGTTITLDLSILGIHPATLEGRVMNCRPNPSHLWVMGVKFLHLSPVQTASLAAYIASVTESVSTS
jgi:c-di-GMP-binding flagellar brake protein YcgR